MLPASPIHIISFVLGIFALGVVVALGVPWLWRHVSIAVN
jgi:hypothetical protein